MNPVCDPEKKVFGGCHVEKNAIKIPGSAADSRGHHITKQDKNNNNHKKLDLILDQEKVTS